MMILSQFLDLLFYVVKRKNEQTLKDLDAAGWTLNEAIARKRQLSVWNTQTTKLHHIHLSNIIEQNTGRLKDLLIRIVYSCT